MWSNWGKWPNLGPSQGLQTHPQEKYLTLWRPDSKNFTFFLNCNSQFSLMLNNLILSR